ncbi:MAG TPA: asparaginase [Stellaceae bacterium]|jgi:L-asparaginase II|nr:asparaginase [Stellaceae bacterium]
MSLGPILVEILRGDLVESRHHGAFAVADAHGGTLHQAGDTLAPVFPRSAIKPLQALPLIESGTADALNLGIEALALACASHGGEALHTEKVGAFLASGGFSESDLECGTHPPLSAEAATALAIKGAKPCQLHNNCSGKHAGFLCTARHLGEEPKGYIARTHPVQARVIRTVSEMTGLDLDHAPSGIDGCGIPVVALSLAGMALAMARLADPIGLHDERRHAATRVLTAMTAQPELVDQSPGMVVDVMRAGAGAIALKPGAEGVFTAALPRLGLGLALKIEDGTSRAAQLAVITLLDRLGAFDEEQREGLRRHLEPPLLNAGGRLVGTLRPSTAFPSR